MTSPVVPCSPPALRPAMVETRNLEVFYGRRQALHGVDLEIGSHEVLALVGPSGCGKSTFLRSLNRMHDLQPGVRVTGEVRIQGEDVYRAGVSLTQLRRRVGMVFQSSNPFPFSIYENVAYGPRVNRMARTRRDLDRMVERCLHAAGLWNEVKDRLHRPALALSGGQQQRLCIARALAVDPDILLMDEPASALDPASTARVEDLILDLKSNYTIVLVTHNLQQAARVSDRTCFFLQGRVIETGDTRTLFTRPRCRETEDYVTGRFG